MEKNKGEKGLRIVTFDPVNPDIISPAPERTKQRVRLVMGEKFEHPSEYLIKVKYFGEELAYEITKYNQEDSYGSGIEWPKHRDACFFSCVSCLLAKH